MWLILPQCVRAVNLTFSPPPSLSLSLSLSLSSDVPEQPSSDSWSHLTCLPHHTSTESTKIHSTAQGKCVPCTSVTYMHVHVYNIHICLCNYMKDFGI